MTLTDDRFVTCLRLSGIALMVAGAIGTSSAHAQNADGSNADRSRVTIGVGAATLPDYEGADENSITPGAIVVGKIADHDFFTRGTQLYFNLIPSGSGPGTNFELGVIGAVRLDRTNKVDDLRVRALGKLDTAWEAGGYVGISRTGVITSDYDTLTVRVAYVHDLSDAHDSYIVTPQINYATPLSPRTLVSVGASADYVGKGYGRTYFGVTSTGALASGLRTYSINDSGWKRYNLTAFVLQSLSGDLGRGFGLGAGVLYGRLLGDYKRSPIASDVGDADQLAAAVGLTYTF
jgi:outer membrane scaffolding protein for murein synthesis (MipA/OmpV family)